MHLFYHPIRLKLGKNGEKAKDQKFIFVPGEYLAFEQKNLSVLKSHGTKSLFL